MTVDILDQGYEPSIEELGNYIQGSAGIMWRELTGFLEDTFKPKSQVTYSVCSGKPGWNLKYKKSGKALCTLYPEKDFFITLVVLGSKDRNMFDIYREDFSGYITELYDSCKLFNGTKWLMINVNNEATLRDVKNLILLKTEKR